MDKSMTSQNQSKVSVAVYFRDGMAISRSLRDTVERIRRHLTRLSTSNRDLYVYTNYAQGDVADGGHQGAPMVKMSLWSRGQSVPLTTKSGTKTQDGISPNTLLGYLEKGLCPEIEL